ncbi:MAG: hypothetical protein WAN76_21340 [Candidatus Sulfotelmatobacter sp.]
MKRLFTSERENWLGLLFGPNLSSVPEERERGRIQSDQNLLGGIRIQLHARGQLGGRVNLPAEGNVTSIGMREYVYSLNASSRAIHDCVQERSKIGGNDYGPSSTFGDNTPKVDRCGSPAVLLQHLNFICNLDSWVEGKVSYDVDFCHTASIHMGISEPDYSRRC